MKTLRTKMPPIWPIWRDRVLTIVLVWAVAATCLAFAWWPS